MPAHAPDRSRTSPRPRRAGVGALLVSLLLGAVVGSLGTLAHLNLMPLGSMILPWGAVLALVLVGSTVTWWARRAGLLAGGVLGAVAFTTAWLWQSLPGDDELGMPWSGPVTTAVPMAVTASMLWLLGLALVVPFSLWWASRGERRPRALRAVDSE
ncbi:MAG: hypothetical protein Q4G34_05460 [Micrococcus sp.]|nr:hypothetical protein [Micrococcus sp.]